MTIGERTKIQTAGFLQGLLKKTRKSEVSFTIGKNALFSVMTRALLTLYILWVSAAGLCAQDLTRFFEIVPPKHKNKIGGSLYNSIEFLDSRSDSALIGLANVGLLKNREAKLVCKTPVQPQLQRLLDSLIDPTAKTGELLFQLRDFTFAETMGARYCYLIANLYAIEKDGYRPLLSLDTVMVITVSDVVGTINLGGNFLLADFIRKALTLEATDSVIYSAGDLTNIDSIERRQIPLYNTTTYVDGLYLTYSSFSKQLPDRQAMIEAKKDGSISSVRVLDEQAKKVKLKSKNVYAVVYKGKPFIATEYGFYPLEIVGDNFFFTGDVRIAATNAEVSGGQFAMGLIGAWAASKGSEETFDMIIDHQNGNFIHLRHIPRPDTP